MEGQSFKDVAAHLLAAGKRKAAANLIERHQDSFQADSLARADGNKRVDLDTALRRGLERIERLREVQATTVENQLKAAMPGNVNRGFREQSTWWLSKQELPKTWFNCRLVTSGGGGGPRPDSAAIGTGQAESSDAPHARPHSAAPRVYGIPVRDPEPASSGDADTSLLGPEASSKSAGRGGGSPKRGTRKSTPGHIGGGGNGMSFRAVAAAALGAAAAAVAKAKEDSGGAAGGSGGNSFGRVAWALARSRRPASSGGDDSPRLYDGGGDDATPGQGSVVPIQPLPGQPRYTVDLFEAQRQLRRRPGDASPEDSFIQADNGESDDGDDGDDDGDDGGATAAADGNAAAAVLVFGTGTGTGHRALADEWATPAGAPPLATEADIAAAAARVAASNAQARGVAGRSRNYFGMVGFGRHRPVEQHSPPPPPPLTGMSPAAAIAAAAAAAAAKKAAAQQPTPAPTPEVSSADAAAAPAAPSRTHVLGRPSSACGRVSVYGPRISRIGNTTPRVSSPGVLVSTNRAGADAGEATPAGGADAAAATAGAAAAQGSSAAGALLTPTPPAQQHPDGRPASAIRPGRTHRTVLGSDGSAADGACPRSLATPPPPGSPPRGASPSDHHGRIRLGSAAPRHPASEVSGAVSPVTPATGAAAGAAAAPGSAAAAALRYRLRVLTAPGATDEGGRRVSSPSGGAGSFSRSILSPAAHRPTPPPAFERSGSLSRTPAPPDAQPAAVASPAAGSSGAASPAALDKPGGAAAAAMAHAPVLPPPPSPPPPPPALERSGSLSRTLLRNSSNGMLASALQDPEHGPGDLFAARQASFDGGTAPPSRLSPSASRPGSPNRGDSPGRGGGSPGRGIRLVPCSPGPQKDHRLAAAPAACSAPVSRTPSASAAAPPPAAHHLHHVSPRSAAAAVFQQLGRPSLTALPSPVAAAGGAAAGTIAAAAAGSLAYGPSSRIRRCSTPVTDDDVVETHALFTVIRIGPVGSPALALAPGEGAARPWDGALSPRSTTRASCAGYSGTGSSSSIVSCGAHHTTPASGGGAAAAAAAGLTPTLALRSSIGARSLSHTAGCPPPIAGFHGGGGGAGGARSGLGGGGGGGAQRAGSVSHVGLLEEPTPPPSPPPPLLRLQGHHGQGAEQHRPSLGQVAQRRTPRESMTQVSDA